MTIDESYRKRLTDLLSDLIEQGRKESGSKKFSYDKLALKISQKLSAIGEAPITPQTLINWHQGKYKRGLDEESARKLGLYFDRPPETAAEDFKAYLAGRRTLSGEDLLDRPKSPQLARAADVVESMKVVPLAIVIEAIEVGLKRLKALAQSQSDMVIIRLIRDALLEKGLNPENPGDLIDFVRCVPHQEDEADMVLWIQQILKGQVQPTQDQLPDLAYAVQVFSGRNFSPEEMDRILSGKCFDNGHATRLS